MATYDEMFGKKNSDRGPKRPPAPKWTNEGDAHSGVITGEPVRVSDFDWGTKKDKYMVKTNDPARLAAGKSAWERKLDGEFDKEKEHFPIEQYAIPVKLTTGEDVTFYFSTDDSVLKDAMADSGLPIAEGITIGKKFLRKDGSKRVYVVKLAQ